MPKADSTNSTATPVAPTRRLFLSTAATLAAGGAALTVTIPPALSAPAGTSEASPALRDAVVSLRESHDRLEAAKACFAADDLKMAEWRDHNPEPVGRRAQKRYWRKWRETQDATVSESWAAQLKAEKDFLNCQAAVANVAPRDENDLVLKAAVAGIYDKTKMASGFDVAIISYSVAWDLFKMRGPA
jgi:hypothetical protein